MSSSINRRPVIGVWLAVLVAVAGAGALSGVSITIALWLFACVVPPAVMLMIWRGARVPTAAEVLHAVDRRD